MVKITKTLCDRRIYHHVSCSQLFDFFPLGCADYSPEIAKFKCAENVIA